MDPLTLKLMEAHRLAESGQAEQALAALLRLLPRHPNHPQLASTTAYALVKLKRDEQAIYYARRAAELSPPPGDPRMLTNLAILLANSTRPGARDEAFALFEKALALNPADHNTRIGVTNLLMQRKLWARAEQVCAEGLAHGLHDQLLLTHAAALVNLGRLRESMNLLARGARAFPDHVRVRSGLASSAIYLSQAHPAEIARLFRDYGEALERQSPRLPERTPPPADAHRPIRVAIISPDLRTHSVAFFIEPFFEHHDRSRITLTAYMTTREEDATSRRLRQHTALWRNLAGMTDDQIAARIRADSIDVLIDLAGHTQGHRLGVLARRPAPVQATYLGFPDTTGLTTIDHRIVDSHTDPGGPVPDIDNEPQPTFDQRATEKLLRLDPCFLCYRPRESAPEPRHDGHAGTVFASFNAARKISVDCIDLWSRLLQRVPDATLVLKAVEFADPEGSRVLADAFAARAVAHRVRFVPPQDSLDEHLAMYNSVDVALDTFPYHGTTTTCETLWMGVPVITLAGDRHASRVGVSILENLGAHEWIATSPDDYAEKAATLAADKAALTRHRATLRTRLAASVICDQKAYATRLTDAIVSMGRQRCQAQP
ncbi:MAG: hypothetical protein U0637_00585 [Phycisphaerales bacterium]